MKNLTKLSVAAFAVTLMGSGISLADDPQLQNLLDAQRTQRTAARDSHTMIGVYAHERTVGRPAADRMATTSMRSKEWRVVAKDNPRGPTTYYLAAQR